MAKSAFFLQNCRNLIGWLVTYSKIIQECPYVGNDLLSCKIMKNLDNSVKERVIDEVIFSSILTANFCIAC